VEQTFQPFVAHTLQSNETLWDVASKYDISVIDLIRYNMEIRNPEHIPSGYTLRIPVVPINRMQIINNIIQTSCQFNGHSDSFLQLPNNPLHCTCNKFIQTIFREHGVNLPLDLWRISELGKEISLSRIEKGDLLFFTTRARSKKYFQTERGYLGHICLYIGNEQILHGFLSDWTAAMITELNDYYRNTFVKAIRIIPAYIPL